MNAKRNSRAFSPLGVQSRHDVTLSNNNWMSMGDKRRHKRGIMSNPRNLSRAKRKQSRRKTNRS